LMLAAMLGLPASGPARRVQADRFTPGLRHNARPTVGVVAGVQCRQPIELSILRPISTARTGCVGHRLSRLSGGSLTSPIGTATRAQTLAHRCRVGVKPSDSLLVQAGLRPHIPDQRVCRLVHRATLCPGAEVDWHSPTHQAALWAEVRCQLDRWTSGVTAPAVTIVTMRGRYTRSRHQSLRSPLASSGWLLSGRRPVHASGQRRRCGGRRYRCASARADRPPTTRGRAAPLHNTTADVRMASADSASCCRHVWRGVPCDRAGRGFSALSRDSRCPTAASPAVLTGSSIGKARWACHIFDTRRPARLVVAALWPRIHGR